MRRLAHALALSALAVSATSAPALAPAPAPAAAPSAAPAPLPSPATPPPSTDTTTSVISSTTTTGSGAEALLTGTLLVEGLQNYSAASAAAVQAALLGLVPPSATPGPRANASQYSLVLTPTNFMAMAGPVLQGVSPALFAAPGLSACFARAAAAATGIPSGNLVVRPATPALSGCIVPLVAYAPTAASLATYQQALQKLGGAAGTPVAGAVAACGMPAQGIFLPGPPTAAVALDMLLSLPPKGLHGAVLLAALNQSTPVMWALRDGGLGPNVTVSFPTPPHFVAATGARGGPPRRGARKPGKWAALRFCGVLLGATAALGCAVHVTQRRQEAAEVQLTKQRLVSVPPAQTTRV